MSAAELILTAMALAPGAAVIVLAHRRGWLRARAEPAPLPIRALAIAAAGTALGALAGTALGVALAERMMVSWLPQDTSLVYPSASDALVEWASARMQMAAVVALGPALPGAAALAWLGAPGERAPRAAWLFGIVLALGYGSGVALGLSLVPAAVDAFLMASEGLGPVAALDDLAAPSGPVLALADLAATVARALVGFGLVGATLTGTAFAASRSPAAWKAALALSGAAFPVSLLLAAWLTPPDAVSQLALATALLAAWAIGLLIAASSRACAVARWRIRS